MTIVSPVRWLSRPGWRDCFVATGWCASGALLAMSGVAAIAPELFPNILLHAFVAPGGAMGAIAVAACTALVSRGQRHPADADVRRLGDLVDALDEGVLICNGMQIAAANSPMRELLGYDDRDLEIRLITSFMRDMEAIDAVLAHRPITLETMLEARDGSPIAVEVAARNVHFAGQEMRLLEVRDIRERKATQARISFLAHHDPLTGLPNRQVLHDRLEAAIAAARSDGDPCAIIWVDLDRFKEINDVFGHATGDALLRKVAEKLRFELPSDALIARIGGDEFVVLCERLVDMSEARLVGQQLRRLLNRPIEVDGRALRVGASIGVAVFPDDAADADELRNADLALYQAKAAGRARCRQFNAEMAQELERRVVLSGDLAEAIESGAIETWFQPLVRARDGRVVAFEALSRWKHPEFGPVPPPEFVRVAEENGLISRLTETVMRNAIAAAEGWPAHIRVSVNVSPIQITSEFVDQVRGLLQSTGFDASRLELEVTENILIHDFDQAASMFARLRAMGVSVAMDDFGAGFTSMANLRRLNFDRIKVDRIFTADLPGHRRSAAIVRAMLVFGRELDLEVTVEGVETADQLAFLRSLGCPEIQGYLFSPPRPLDAWTPEAIADIARLHPHARGEPETDSSLIDLSKRRTRRVS